MIVSELFDDVGDKHQKKIAIDTVKNPNKSLLGGPSPEEAEKMLKDKFGMSDKQIQKLKEGTMGIGLLGDDPKEINQAGYELISKLKAPVKPEDVYSFIEQRLSDDSLADSMYLMTKEAYMDPRFKDSYGKHVKEIESIDARSILLHHLVGRDSALMYYGIGPALVGLFLAQQGVKAVKINMDMDLPDRNDEPLITERYGINVDVLKKEIERMWGKLPDMDQMALTQTYKAIGGTPKITAPAESMEEDYEKGRGPTGIAYAIKKGHPDAEDPATRKKYPERQTPEYKKKFFKLNKEEKVEELAPVVGALARAAGYGAANAVMDKIKKKFENKTPGDSHYNKEKAKELAKKDGKDPEKLTYGELMSYIEKAEKMEEGHKATHVVVDPDGNVMGHASDEKGAKDIAKDNLRNVKGKVFKLKKPASEKKADRMLGYKLDEPTESAELKSFKELINQII